VNDEVPRRIDGWFEAESIAKAVGSGPTEPGRQHDEVIGVVVLTYNFYPPEVKQIIDVLSKEQFGYAVFDRGHS
jgi:hypothetical protein